MTFTEYQATDLPKTLAKELATPFWEATLDALRSMNDVHLNLDLPIGIVSANGAAIGSAQLAQERVFRNLQLLASPAAPPTELPDFPVVPPDQATE